MYLKNVYVIYRYTFLLYMELVLYVIYELPKQSGSDIRLKTMCISEAGHNIRIKWSYYID